MAIIHCSTAELKKRIAEIHAGDEVFLSGTVYTARDAAHKRIRALLEAGEPLPFPFEGAVIYYAGPTPERPGCPIGSCGPTTSSRMDVYTPQLLENGLCAMIGKGPRSPEVVQAIIQNKAAYFCAIGGAGALAAMAVKKMEVIAFEELGCESVKRLEVEEFPVLCAIDSYGMNLFDRNQK